MSWFNKFLVSLLVVVNVFMLQLSNADFSRYAKAAEPVPKELTQAEKEFALIPKSGKVELEELRTQTSKTYLKSDGSKQLESYLSPIHFKDASKGGNWTEINSSLKFDTTTFGSKSISGYSNSANDFKLSLSTDLSQGMFSLQKNGSAIDIKPQEVSKGINVNNLNLLGGGIANRSYAVGKDKITYDSVYADTNFTLYSTDSGVKEDIVLNRYSGKNIYKFDLNLKNAVFIKNTDGSYTFNNKLDGSYLFTIPRFYMWDSNGGTDKATNVTSYDVASEILPNSNGFEVTVSADKGWLADPARVYPVIIDPSFQALDDYEDTYIQSGYSSSAWKAWNQARMWLGNMTGYSYKKGVMRPYVLFNPSDIINGLKNARINSATFSVVQDSCSGDSCQNYVDAYLTTPFNPWEIYWDSNAGNAVYGPYASAASSTTWGWLNFDVKRAVEDWTKVDPAAVQVGGLEFLARDDGQLGSRTWIATNDPNYGSLASGDQKLGPRLVVDYNDYNASYEIGGALNGVATTTLNVPVTLRNTGRNWWSAGNTALSYHLVDPAGRRVVFDGEKTYLPRDIAPGGDAISVTAKVKVPAMAGNYTIQWDIIQPGVTWFYDQGIPMGNQSLSVSLPSFSSVMHMGSEDYYSKMGPIDLATGNITFSSTDMSVPSESGGLAVGRSYNSADVTKKYSADSNGFVHKWLLNGLYRDDNPASRLSTSFLGTDATVRPNEGTSSSNNLWYAYEEPGTLVNLNTAFAQNGTSQYQYFQNGAGYAHTYIYSPTDRDVLLKFGSDDGARIWLDSNLVFEADYGRGAAVDQDTLPLRLSKGWHSLMMKVTQYGGDWQLCARFTDTGGVPMLDLTYALNNPELFQAQGPLGQGWTLSFEEKIYGQDQGNIYYKDANGSINLFVKKPSGGYVVPAGVNYDLSRDCNGGYWIEYKDGTYKQFDSIDGHLVSIEDNRHHYIKFVYNQLGKVSSIEESGRSILIGYKTNGTISYVKDQQGTIINYIYDTAITPPRFMGLNYPDKSTHRYSFTDTTGYRISKFMDQRGIATYFKYVNDKVGFIYDANSGTTRINYNGQTTEVIDPLGRKSLYKFNEVNLLTNATDAKGYEEFYQYDGHYNIVARYPVIPENSDYFYKYSYVYDENYNLISESDPLNNTSRYAYSQYWNELLTATDPKGTTRSYTYSDYNKHALISETDPMGNVTNYGYDARWQLAYKEDAKAKRTTYTYNTQGDLLTETSPKGETITYGYDAMGKMVSEKSPTGKISLYTYGVMSRLIKVTDPGGLAISYGYDRNGNKTAVGLPDEKVRSYVYDNLNRLITFTDEGGVSINYAYDKVGNYIKVTDGNSKSTTYQYDELNQMVSSTDSLGNVTKVNYDRNGNISSSQDENGTVASNSYNRAGQLTNTSTPGGNTSIGYDQNGNVSNANHDQSGESISAIYNANGNVVSANSSATGTNSFVYSSLNQIAQSSSSTNNVSYTYDANGQLTAVNNSLTGSGVIGTISMIRDADGKLLSLKKQNGDLTKYTYDNSFRIANINTADKDGGLYLSSNYTYDNASNITSDTNLAGKVVNYSYDARGQLLSDQRATYTYDAMGNRQSMLSSGKTTSYAYDTAGDANRLTATTDGSGKTTAYEYDKSGNITKATDASGAVTTNVYDEDGFFIKSILPDNTIVEYSFDKLAKLRTQRKQTNPDGSVKITKFVYDSDMLVSETDESGNVQISYTWDKTENLASFAYTNPDKSVSKYYYLKNAKGDILGFANVAGRQVAKYVYDSWGKVLSAEVIGTPPAGQYQDAGMNPRLYGSYWYDSTLKLYFMKTRMYDPAIGRFLSPDNQISGNTALAYNPYLYCANNPISRIDPNGKSWWSIVAGAVIGVAVVVAAVFEVIGAAIALAVAVVAAAVVGAAISSYEYYRQNRGHTTWGGFGRAAGNGAVEGVVGAVTGAAVALESLALLAAAGAGVSQLLARGGSSAPIMQEAAPIVENSAARTFFSQGHHVDPQYLGGPTTRTQGAVFEDLSVPYHQSITNGFRATVPYGSQEAIRLRGLSASDPLQWRSEMDAINNQVYSQYPISNWPLK